MPEEPEDDIEIDDDDSEASIDEKLADDEGDAGGTFAQSSEQERVLALRMRKIEIARSVAELKSEINQNKMQMEMEENKVMRARIGEKNARLYDRVSAKKEEMNEVSTALSQFGAV